jgi:5-carboxymethyl-2-hydroxymuconate isomerase
MPHPIVEYSANIEGDVDMPRLLSAIHAAALETGVFPLGGVRVRAERRDLYAIADQHRDNAFIHVQARICIGRAPEVRQKAAEHIFAAVKSETARAFARRPMGLSLEVVEIAPVGRLTHNNLHAAVEARRKGSAA